MANHCYRMHSWSYKNNAPATENKLAKNKEKLLEKKKNIRQVLPNLRPRHKKSKNLRYLALFQIV